MPFTQDLVIVLAPVRDFRTCIRWKTAPAGWISKLWDSGALPNPDSVSGIFPRQNAVTFLCCFISKDIPNILDFWNDNSHYRPCFRVKHTTGLGLALILGIPFVILIPLKYRLAVVS